jgi:CMP-N-acetylneuraminic acid synthetase
VKYLGIIPARGGSKGVPRKNIRLLAGHPLLAWTIRAALDSRRLTRAVVSTEDEEIAAAAEAYGAEVLIRPAHLAADEVLSREVVAQALAVLDAEHSVLLQPTSPLRSPGLVDRVIETFEAGAFDSLATGFEHPLYPPHGVEHRRQDLKYVFVNDGSVIVSTRATVEAQSLFGARAGTMVTSRQENVDIDTEFDFWLAGQLVVRALAQGWDIEPRRL